jgi:hypothetical protein
METIRIACPSGHCVSGDTRRMPHLAYASGFAAGPALQIPNFRFAADSLRMQLNVGAPAQNAHALKRESEISISARRDSQPLAFACIGTDQGPLME